MSSHTIHQSKPSSTSGIRAILVSVDYTDLLSISLPYNRHHFSEVCVVTSTDKKEIDSLTPLCVDNNATLYSTDAFYKGGARFNKWLALEEALDWYGREGWLCLMDADILWPKDSQDVFVSPLKKGYLYSPLRRVCEKIDRPYAHSYIDANVEGEIVDRERVEFLPYPSERVWGRFPLHGNQGEWAGYTQIFHAEDPVLVKKGTPWHDTNWIHAGGADSFFQAMWPKAKKIRLPFEVLHLGPPGENWMGRVTPYADTGAFPENFMEKKERVDEIWRQRRKNRAEGKDPYTGEKF